MSGVILTKLQNNKISIDQAYKTLFDKPNNLKVSFFRRAHFLKLNIQIPEEKGVSTFLKILFFLPIPLFIIRIFLVLFKLNKYSKKIPLSNKEIIQLITHRGISVIVNAKSGEKIIIKTI